MIPRRVIEMRVFRPREGYVAGLDEVGRGAWAGPMVAAAVILPRGVAIPGVRDSKALSAQQREEKAHEIEAKAHAWSYGVVSHTEIDAWGLTEANRMAFVRALAQLQEPVGHALVDGSVHYSLPAPATFITRGDRTEYIIAAASILAKVFRDRLVRHAHILYPEYGLYDHKGYGTEAHRRAIKKFGITPFHRRSFIHFQ